MKYYSFFFLIKNFNSEINIDRIYANLSTIQNYEIYKKSQIPDEYHYKSNIRIGGKFIYFYFKLIYFSYF